MAITNKLIITLLLLISIAVVHCLSFRVEIDEFEPPQQGEQEGPRRRPGGGSGEGWEEESTNHPYHFRKRSFSDWFQSKEGFVRVLPKFTKHAPALFRGIENYRFSLVEMEPTTFFVPHHLDADAVFIVLQGKGVIEFVTDKTKESFHITKGDVVRIPSGVTNFITNTNQTVPLRLAQITVPVNNPGNYKVHIYCSISHSYVSFIPRSVVYSYSVSIEVCFSDVVVLLLRFCMLLRPKKTKIVTSLCHHSELSELLRNVQKITNIV